MVHPPVHPDAAPLSSIPVKVNWEGSLFVHHSLGMVNRELLCALAADTRLTVRHVPYEPDSFSPGVSPKFEMLSGILSGAHVDAAVHVRHRWPPDFTLPSRGRHVLFQPWEYGSLPVEWVKKIPEVVREVWVYTHYLRECYIASGLNENIIRVVPLGVDPDVFKPDATPAPGVREKTGERYSFLFNGGITLRKGVDILINAYLNEFRPDEQVCLVVKGSNAYRKELAAKVEQLALRSDIAKMVYLTHDILPQDLPALYAACDCYVQPYRAEGYGLPVAEAMACGKPVIVTGAGACRDFADEQTAYLIKCSLEKLAAREVDGIQLVGNAFWLSPDVNDLRRLMRYVFENREEARGKGIIASKKIREHHTWKHSAEIVVERILSIANF